MINVHIYPSPILYENRILKITDYLEKTMRFSHIYVMGTSGSGLPDYENISEGRSVIRLHGEAKGSGLICKIVRTIKWSARAWLKARRLKPSCINCHSLAALPLCVALKLATHSKLIYDTHELETETANSVGLRKILAKFTERLLIHIVDEVVVVNEYIRRWYQRSYGLKKVWTIQNLAMRKTNTDERTHPLRDKFSIPEGDQVFLYQGAFGCGRGIELMLKVFAHVSQKKHLLLLGYGELTDLIIGYSNRFSNIHFHPAVSPEILPLYTVDADIGLCLIENICLSYYHCLPNKLFEYIACGVPVITSDFPEMSTFVRRLGCGWPIEPTVEALSKLVNGLNREALVAPRKGAIEARNECGWETEEATLGNLYDRLGFFSKMSGIQPNK